MIGRGALGRPWILRGADVSRDERARIIRRHAALIETHAPPRLALVQLKKHLAWYAHGLPGAARMRPALFQAADAAACRAVFWQLWDEQPAA
jgi:tRNA-dihydrouridine synthase